MPLLQCIVVTPETTVLDEMVDFVALPLYDGEIGIASGHSPMIGRLGCGEMRIRNDEVTTRYYVEGGFVQVAANVVSVLTGRAVPAESIDLPAAEEALHAALARPGHSSEQMALRERALSQARGQLTVVRHAVRNAAHS
jgi:F-type H+-transporting ATPase subunit epsilon